MIEDELWIFLGILLLVILIVIIYLIWKSGGWKVIWDFIMNIRIPKPWMKG
jgi:ABC-type sulfate transport system permease component